MAGGAGVGGMQLLPGRESLQAEGTSECCS